MFYQGGPKRDLDRMIAATARLRDQGEMPPAAALMLSQLVLNLGGKAGLVGALELLGDLLRAADVPPGGPKKKG